jgi:hypothetical protein
MTCRKWWNCNCGNFYRNKYKYNEIGFKTSAHTWTIEGKIVIIQADIIILDGIVEITH